MKIQISSFLEKRSKLSLLLRGDSNGFIDEGKPHLEVSTLKFSKVL